MRSRFQVFGPALAQPLQLANRRLVTRRWSPVLPIFFQERHGSQMRQLTSNLLLIDQNEALSRRNQARNLLYRRAQTPGISRFGLHGGRAEERGPPRPGQNGEQGVPIDRLNDGARKFPKIARRPHTSMPLQFVAAETSLGGFISRRANDDGFAASSTRVTQELHSDLLLQVFNHIAQEDQIISRQGFDDVAGVANVDLAIQVTMHLGQIGRM